MCADTVPASDSARFIAVESEAEFNGGERAWANFIGERLDGDVPVRNGAPLGKYEVRIQFIVSIDGKVTDIKALTNHGYGMEREVIRVIKLSPKWKPAMMKEGPVKAYRLQPITFVVEKDKKKRRGK